MKMERLIGIIKVIKNRQSVCPHATLLSAVPGGPGVTDLHPTGAQTGVTPFEALTSAANTHPQRVLICYLI